VVKCDYVSRTMMTDVCAHEPFLQSSIPVKTVGNFLLQRSKARFGFEEMAATNLLKTVVLNAVLRKEFTTKKEVRRQLTERELIQDIVDKHYK